VKVKSDGTEQRIVVVTGGASGIGEATVRKFVNAGDFVVIGDLAEENAKVLAEELGADNALAWRIDVGDASVIQAAAEAIEEQIGAVDVLVNCAGILQDPGPVEAIENDALDRVWQIDYRGTYMCCKYFGLPMTKRHRGAIVNISSVSGMVTMQQPAYGPAKAAVIHLTGFLGVDYGRRGVRVNSVAPGMTLTPIQRRNIEAGLREANGGSRLTALNRWVLPEEIAEGVFFLASDNASAITGVTLPVDAGLYSALAWPLLSEIEHEVGPPS
jgi:NAD(P)-dependent dehydrogenase (short-subunit alcohol dehydrogenase family)